MKPVGVAYINKFPHMSMYLSIYDMYVSFDSLTIIHIWQVFAKGVEKDSVVLMAARASRLENQDAIDCAIVSMLADPKEVHIQRSFTSYMIQNTSFCYCFCIELYNLHQFGK